MWIGKVQSLEDLCLKSIVKEFDRFYLAFATTSNDGYWNRHFEFLQRRYSYKLALELSSNWNLKSEYCEIVINRHLGNICDEWFVNNHYLGSLKAILGRLPNLTVIRSRYCGNELLQHIAELCPKIVEIDVGFSDVNDYGVSYLYKRKNGMLPCPELKIFFVQETFVTGRGVENLLRKLPSLESLEYTNLPMVLFHMRHADYKTKNPHYCNLTDLNLSNFYDLDFFAEVLESCFVICPKLKSLTCNITDEEELNSFTGSHLKKLELTFLPEDRKLNMDNFLKQYGCHLTSLSISNCAVSLSLLAVHCPFLKEIIFLDVNALDEDDNSLPTLSSLTQCEFRKIDVPVSDLVISLLSRAPNLETVAFTDGILSTEVRIEILVWCKRPSAKKIHFNSVELQMEFLKMILLNCLSLKMMTLFSCNVDVDEPMEELLRIVRSTRNEPEVFYSFIENPFAYI